ncbi:MAG: VWA domain-containing protein [Candidatus Rokuibacteriota bacterium]|nr:MAG: VWA domain-containing protein [Candidatus Rokubacteria bacterium]
MLHRYSRWDGTQSLPDLDADDLLSAIADDVMSDGDVMQALRRLFQRGMTDPQGQRMSGLQDLLQRLRQRRQQQLNRYDLGSMLDDIKKKLDEIVKTEREGIRRESAKTQEQAERGEVSKAAQRRFDQVAAQKHGQLDQLPPDPAGRIRDLQNYEFMDADAKKMFDELLKSLQEQMLKPFMSGMQQALQNMTPEDLARLREMIQDINRMLRDRAEGREPDFQKFKDKWGQQFPGAESLDDLIEQLAQQAAQMQSLLSSMSPGQREQLEEMMRNLFGRDERLEAAMRQLAMHLSEQAPLDEMIRQYKFRGDEDVNLREAMQLMEELQQLEQLEQELKGARSPNDLDKIDPGEIEKLLGPEAAQDLERLRELIRRLVEAGYLEQKGDELELTARAIRKIGDKALRDIFTHLKRDRFGRHAVERRGAGGDRTDESKAYEFGDPFMLDLEETLMNAVRREGPGTPVRLSPADFEVYRTEFSTRAATVVMLDMSRSMLYNGCFLPAKKVALALHSLIRAQFPRDALHIVGFSLYAREFEAEQLPGLTWSDWSVGTNMHAGFLLSRQLLGRHKGGNKQVIMITDGEPTAHLEGAEADFSYPPTRRTFEETLREVHRCTREGIVINTFMLERSPMLSAFVEQMAKINRGRAFFASAERLGEYVLVDYVNAKRRRVG